jgi:hypothetical protein
MSVLQLFRSTYTTRMTRSQRVYGERIVRYRTSVSEPDGLDDVHRDYVRSRGKDILVEKTTVG